MSGRLPTFLGIGTAKAGSTSLHHYLGEHPEIYMSPRKETNFFAYEGQRGRRFRVRSWAAYRAQFAGARDEKAVGEFSPIYMDYPSAARRIAEGLPDAKLVASLRSPADRAYSCWLGSVCTGLERESAESAIRPWSRYLERGFYRERLAPYLALFPREHLHVVIFEDLIADPAATLAKLHRFLGVDPGFVQDFSRRHNAARFPRHPRLNRLWQAARRLQPRDFVGPEPLTRWHASLLERSYTKPPAIDPQLRARLVKVYRDEVGRMEELLGRELPTWRR